MSRFDPLALFEHLERKGVAYVIVGDLAGVLHGSALLADTIEICPSLKSENTQRLQRALSELGVPEKASAPLNAIDTDSPAFSIGTPVGELRVISAPPGTGGYEDLRRAARREPLGRGVRAAVASAQDLVRSLAVEGRDGQLEQRLRRLIDLERDLSPGM